MPRKAREDIEYHKPRAVPGKKNLYITWSECGRSKRLSTGTADKQEATRFYNQFLAGIHAPDVPDTVYLSDALKEYIGTQGQQTYAPKRLEQQTRLAQEFFGDVPVERITRSQCIRYAEWRYGQGVSAWSIRRELGIVRAAVNWVYKEGWIASAPYIQLPATPPPRERYLTKEECRKLVNAAIACHVKTFIVLGLTTGARKAAICDLTWDRVDFDNRLIDYRVSDMKRKKGRAVVSMNDLCFSQLKEARLLAQSDYVIEWGGKQAKNMNKAFRETVARAGLGSEVTPHIMRHTAATLAAQGGASMHDIAGMLGHSDVTITSRVYAKHSPEHMRKVTDLLKDVG